MTNKYLFLAAIFSLFLNIYLVSEIKNVKSEFGQQISQINTGVNSTSAMLTTVMAKISEMPMTSSVKSGLGSKANVDISDSSLQLLVKRIVSEEVSSSTIQSRAIQSEAQHLANVQQKIDQVQKYMQESMANPGSAQTKDLIVKVKAEILSECKK